MQSVVLDSVHKTFCRGGFFFRGNRRTETYALKGISLSIACGEVLALLGPNGSGKSTTLKLISTILLPDRGSVRVNGLDTRRHGREVRRQIGIALASERSFFPRLTARENLNFFAALENVPRRERAERVESALHAVDLVEAADKHVMKFSSGMYQRLGMARALIKHARVLLLDEPTRSLDPAAAGRLLELIRKISATGVTIVHATHNLHEALSVSDRIAILEQGCISGLRRTASLSYEELKNYYLQAVGEPASCWAEGVPA